MIIAVAVTAAASFAPNLLWSLLNVLTIIAFFPLQNIEAPPFVNYFCSSFLGLSFLPIFADYVFDPNEYIGQEPFQAAVNYMYTNTVFLVWGN
jgi:hypothetical protein